jgi:hypothetical protein
MEPVKGWQDVYVCGRCGRIVNQNTLEVVGRKAETRSLKVVDLHHELPTLGDP